MEDVSCLAALPRLRDLNLYKTQVVDLSAFQGPTAVPYSQIISNVEIVARGDTSVTLVPLKMISFRPGCRSHFTIAIPMETKL